MGLQIVTSLAILKDTNWASQRIFLTRAEPLHSHAFALNVLRITL